jgi:hypothetical protein
MEMAQECGLKPARSNVAASLYLHNVTLLHVGQVAQRHHESGFGLL